ncbi:hypothetical protein [Halobacillus litoralis]|nr:hypothetical protein [Halobacillus litoralis]
MQGFECAYDGPAPVTITQKAVQSVQTSKTASRNEPFMMITNK